MPTLEEIKSYGGGYRPHYEKGQRVECIKRGKVRRGVISDVTTNYVFVVEDGQYHEEGIPSIYNQHWDHKNKVLKVLGVQPEVAAA